MALTYLPHSAIETMDGLLSAASPALRAWLLHPEGFYPWGRPLHPDAKPEYTYARVAETVRVFHQARVTNDADTILRARATALYTARLDFVDILDAARGVVDRYAKSWKAFTANPLDAKAFDRFLPDYALAVETLLLLWTCANMLLRSAAHLIPGGIDPRVLKLDHAFSRAAAKRLTDILDKIRAAVWIADGALPIMRLARWRGAQALNEEIPAGDLRSFADTLTSAYSGLTPTAIRALLRSLETALNAVQEKWVAFLRDVAPNKGGLDLRLPFGRPLYDAGDTERGRALRLANRRKVSLEGFDLTYNGEIDIPAMRAEEIRERLRPVLARYRQQARRYFPTLIEEFTPHLDVWFYNAFGDATPGGHHYGSGRGIGLYPRNYRWFDAAEPTTGLRDRVVHVIAHEAGHRIWRTVLNERQREAWTALVTQQTPIDYDAILAAFDAHAPARSVYDLLPALREHAPVLELQIAIASSVYDPDYVNKASATAWRYMDPRTYKDDPRPLWWFSRDEIKALRDEQKIRKVPVFPITGYAATNPEEAWCDAFGNLMAYGPMAVLEPIRELIYRFFPTIRRNPEQDDERA